MTAHKDRLLRLRDVMHLTGLGRSTIYRKVKDSSFPVPVKVGQAAVRWKESDVTAWIESL